ncbi:Serine/threonine-protein kinase [Rhizophlyctis rosea]|uniref:non-specific serine/threonine protein kinase n=1 Tax=Rhizophlyctis rosea TaxID=64517 RepID=A0AAD5S298_9FUNG|nr:Serine/threonine-protein kinase [Rhizophlyctis rosea]
MAPEILRGDRYDAKADLWSLGAILYETLTGRPPFKAQNHIDLLRKIDRGEGWIRFPGEEGTESRVVGSGGAGGISRRVSSTGLGTSPGTVGVGSYGTSPRFPVVQGNVVPISEGLKDLVRRLLKRNPVERMTFEEFFVHECVVGGGRGSSGSGIAFGGVEGSVYPPTAAGTVGLQGSGEAASPLGVPGGTTVGSVGRVSSLEGAREPVRRATISGPVDERQAGLSGLRTNQRNSGMEVPRVVKGGSPVGSLKGLGGMEGVGGVNRPELGRLVSAPVLQGSGSHVRITSFGAPPFSQQPEQNVTIVTDQPGMRIEDEPPPFSSQIFEPAAVIQPDVRPSFIPTTSVIEPPFPGYDVDPAFFTAAAATNRMQPPQLIAHSPPDVTSPTAETEEGGSSLSSIGSLEISDPDDEAEVEEKERIVHIVRRSSSGGSPKSAEKHQQPSPTVQAQAGVAAGRKANKGSGSGLDEYVVVEKRVVEVNWLADEVASATAGSQSAGGSSPPFGRQDSGGSPSSQHVFPPPPPRRSLSREGPFVEQQGGGGQRWAEGSQQQRGATPPSPRMMSKVMEGSRVQRVAGDVAMKGRIFGSLRESTHSFLSSPTTATPTTTTTMAGGPMGLNAYATAAAITVPIGNRPVGMMQNSVVEDHLTMLGTLKVCSLRANAVHQLADAHSRLAADTPSRPSSSPTQTTSSSYSTLLEETLSLYLHALSLYQLSMDVAKNLWEKQRSSIPSHNTLPYLFTLSASTTAANPELVTLNTTVAWVRDRFNECLEKAETVRHVLASIEGGDESEGRCVEKVVYERALEVSRWAAVTELEASNSLGMLEKVENGYQHAVLLLEALLHCPDPGDGEAGMTDEDRMVVERFVANLYGRLGGVRNKLRV